MVALLMTWWIAVAAAVAVGGQEAAPAPAAGAPSTAAPIDVKAQWQAMSSAEREELARNWQRWQSLASEDRAVMVRRHQRLERARRREHETLGSELPRDWQRLDERGRTRELSRRALGNLRAKFESLPPELRDRMSRDLNAQPPREREKRAKQALEPYLDFAVPELVKLLVERGGLPSEAAAEFTRKLKRDPAQRLALVKQLVGEHAEAFRLPPEDAERVRRSEDPGAGLRLIDRARRKRGGANGPILPRFPRPPRDGPPPEGAPRDGMPPPDGPPPEPRRRAQSA